MTLDRWRRLKSSLFVGFCGFSMLVALLPLALIFGFVLLQGMQALTLDFFIRMPKPVGEVGGGVGNAILGTLYMVGLASLLGLPLGIGAGIFLAERGDGKLGHAVRFTAEVLAGVPSIVVGVVAYGLIVIPMRHFSALAGAVTSTMKNFPAAGMGR